jgi:hypothetical protein
MEEEKTIFLSTSKPQAAFTAVAATDIITSAAHGLQTNDLVQLTTTGTLPAGLSLATDYYVISRTLDTFQLSLTPGGSAVDITDTGTGTHTFNLKGKVIYVGELKTTNLTIDFSGTPTMTVKVQGSVQGKVDFNAAQSATNRWDYVAVVDLNSGTAIAGDTGIACTGTADHRLVEVNISTLEWITVVITAWTAGMLGVTSKSYA